MGAATISNQQGAEGLSTVMWKRGRVEQNPACNRRCEEFEEGLKREWD
jgi:hypothetical protein